MPALMSCDQRTKNILLTWFKNKDGILYMDAKTNEIYTALPSVKSMSQTLVDIGLMLGLAKIKYLTQ